MVQTRSRRRRHTAALSFLFFSFLPPNVRRTPKMAGKVSDFDRWIRTINEPRGSGPGTPATHTVHLTVMQFTPHVGWCVFQERLLLVFRLVPALDWNGTRVVVGLVVCACAARLVSWQKKKKSNSTGRSSAFESMAIRYEESIFLFLPDRWPR